jgi:hypothetical protein
LQYLARCDYFDIEWIQGKDNEMMMMFALEIVSFDRSAFTVVKTTTNASFVAMVNRGKIQILLPKQCSLHLKM